MPSNRQSNARKETEKAERQTQMFELHNRVLEWGILVIFNIVERVSEPSALWNAQTEVMGSKKMLSPKASKLRLLVVLENCKLPTSHQLLTSCAQVVSIL